MKKILGFFVAVFLSTAAPLCAQISGGSSGSSVSVSTGNFVVRTGDTMTGSLLISSPTIIDGGVSLGGYTTTIASQSIFTNSLVTSGASANFNKFRLALAKTKDGLSDTKVLFIGDSTTRGIGSTLSGTFPSYGSYLQRVSLGGDVQTSQGLGVLSLNVGNNPDNRFTRLTGWGIGSNFGFSDSCASASSVGSTTTFSFTPGASQGTFDKFDVYYLQFAGGGLLSVWATGGSTTTVDTNGAAGVLKVTVTAATASVNNVVYAGDNTGQVYVCGFEPYLSTVSKVRLGNAGVGGSYAAGIWDQEASNFGSLPSIRSYAPDLCVISLGINDATNNTTATAFQASMQTIIGACQQSGDVLLMTMPPSTGAPYTTLEPQYVSAYYNLASTNNIPLLDIFKRFGSAYNSAYMFDPYHPTQYGYWDWGADLSQFLQQNIGISGISDVTKVLKTGDTMTGNLFATSGFFVSGSSATFSSTTPVTISSAVFVGLSLSTQASAGAGAATTATCPAGKFAVSCQCDCSGGVALTGDTERFNCVTAGCVPTACVCQQPGGTGGSCAAYVNCSRLQ